jgi:glutathione synthase/RimK-type ligase-like ATP-grasp enzyme
MGRNHVPTRPASAPVAIATCTAMVGKEKDDLRLIDALGRRGIEAVHAAWDDANVDWSLFPLVVIRSTWDYPDRRSAFVAWASKLPRVINPAPVLRWNTDKRYLHDLANAGLPIIPTRFLEPTDVFEPFPVPFVVKPAVSCGAKNTIRYERGDQAEALDQVRRLQAQSRTVMVQPYLAEVEAQGEINVVWIGGAYSHAIRRTALLKHSGQSGENQPLDVQPHEATPQERSLADRVMSFLAGGPSALLYGRVDLVPGANGEPMILEVELTEPSLFLAYSAGACRRLADCIASAVSEPRS